MSHKIKWLMTFPLVFLLVLVGNVTFGEVKPPSVHMKPENWALEGRPTK